ncbi:MAG: hypothetical protein IPL76_10320 [Gemmatimonadetes bacterium]|nr:hypothetical protein [Gemmatimonadota bacterium]
MSRLYVTVVSLWVWFVLGATLLLWLPLLALVRLVTMPFDKGRYWTGYLFRRGRADHRHAQSALALPGHRRDAGQSAPALRGRLQSRIVRRHPAHQPPAQEMKWLSKVEILRIPVLGWNMRPPAMSRWSAAPPSPP